MGRREGVILGRGTRASYLACRSENGSDGMG